MDLALAVLVSFAVAALAPAVHVAARHYTGYVLALVPAAIFAYYLYLLPGVVDGDIPSVTWQWVPALGINFALRLDGLSLLFGLLISGIGVLVVIYAQGYLKGDARLGRFYLYLFAFMGAMLGLTAANDIVTLFVAWELTSISSYLLIGYYHEDEQSRASALQALLVTGGGGLAMLAGLVLASLAAGTADIGAIVSGGDVLRDHGHYLAILLLILAGAATKSAQFPFHFWLPGAMAAPTPVSAYLHSATMVKAGVYLLARFHPALGGTTEWTVLVTGIGAVTMVVGAYLALNQYDLKRILAYSTVSALGTLIMALGVGDEHALEAMAVFLVGHAVYKGSLFMIAGAVDHETGTRDVRHLGGLRRTMPVTAVVAGISALALAGLPPFLAFVGKEVLIDAALEAELDGRLLVLGAVFVANVFLVVAAGVVSIGPFLGEETHTPKHPHEAPWSMLLGPLVLAVLSVSVGVLPFVADGITGSAASAMAGTDVDVHLALWHGVNTPLLFSVAIVVTGLLAYRFREPLRRVTAPAEAAVAGAAGPERGYDVSLAGLKRGAAWQTAVLQHGRLRRYLATVLLATTGLLAFTAIVNGGFALRMDLEGVRFYEWFFAGIILAAGIVCATVRNRFFAVAALGVVGVGSAAIYILFGAPDLALTQLLVDTLTVILFVLVFYHLPAPMMQSRGHLLGRDAVIAVAFGATMTLLLLGAAHPEGLTPVSGYFGDVAYVEAIGRNVVNVILVDFRALDTLGEITVLAVAALGAYALLKLRPHHSDDAE